MKRRKIKTKTGKVGIFITALVSGCTLLVACGSSDAASIEEQVANALQASANATVEETIEEETPEPALEYVDVEEPDYTMMETQSLADVTMEQTVADEQGNTETVKEPEEIVEDDGVLQIVFMGDSIFDNVRDETGIAHLVAEELDADVYNLGIGGTSGGLRMDKSTDFATWNEPNFHGVIYSMEGKITNGLLDGYKAGEVMQTLDPSKTDYFVIEYGTNDFLWYIPLGSANMGGRYYNYFSTALIAGMQELKSNYPDAKILFCTPYYEEFWSADRSRFIGDANTTSNGYGTLLDYINVSENSAKKAADGYIDMYDLLGIDLYNINDMTVDGIHPAEATRKMYAHFVAKAIQDMEEGTFDQEKWDPEKAGQ